MIDFMGLGFRRMVDHEYEEPVTFGMFLITARKITGTGAQKIED
jgi:hypothetical protein